MTKHLLTTILLLLTVTTYEQLRDTGVNRTAAGKIIHKLQVGFPEGAAFGIHQPFKSKRLSQLPHAASEIFNSEKVSFSGRIVFGSYNSSNRIISLTWKKKFGIDLYRAQYSLRVDLTLYNNKLQEQNPNYYTAGTKPTNGGPGGSYGEAEISLYAGWLYGIHYTIPVKKYLLQPKLLVGSGNANGWWGKESFAIYTYKQQGSNYPMTSTVTYGTEKGPKGIYVAEVVFCRHFTDTSFLKKHLLWDLGIKANLAVKPYNYSITITDQKWQQQPDIHVIKGGDTRVIPSVNLYVSICTK